MEVDDVGGCGDKLAPIGASHCDTLSGRGFLITLVTHREEVIRGPRVEDSLAWVTISGIPCLERCSRMLCWTGYLGVGMEPNRVFLSRE